MILKHHKALFSGGVCSNAGKMDGNGDVHLVSEKTRQNGRGVVPRELGEADASAGNGWVRGTDSYTPPSPVDGDRLSEEPDVPSLGSVLALITVLSAITLCMYYSQQESDSTFLSRGSLTPLLILLIDLCGGLLYSVAMAVMCFLFTLFVTYFDSLEPGLHPPTPLSPMKIREKSGHTFHLSYVMPVINGAAIFICTLWVGAEGTTVV